MGVPGREASEHGGFLIGLLAGGSLLPSVCRSGCVAAWPVLKRLMAEARASGSGGSPGGVGV